MMFSVLCFGFLTLTLAECATFDTDAQVTLALIKESNPDLIKFLLLRGRLIKDELYKKGEEISSSKHDVPLWDLKFLDILSLKCYEFFQEVFTNNAGSGVSPHKIICFPKGCINIGDVGIRP